MQRARIFAGNSNPILAEAMARHLDTQLGKADVGTFSDGEVNVEIHENVRGMDCFVIQSTSSPANNHLMELLIMIDALRRSSAKRITGSGKGSMVPRSASSVKSKPCPDRERTTSRIARSPS
ncbi:MAG: ribose-phosphate pyrophosphokinase-like domain-containing protein [Myxococcales bacterium]|nr:ribose-phosphate pyrophosphokinase-like domain-containing protein [Myxococcales bacterium]